MSGIVRARGGRVALRLLWSLAFTVSALGSATSIAAASIDSKPQPPTKTIVDVVSSNSKLSIFARMLKTAGLVKLANGKAQYTVFAPTDAAFNKLTKASFKQLSGRKAAGAFVAYHTIKGNEPSSAFAPTQTVPTLLGDTIKIDVVKTPPTLTDPQGNTSDLPVGDTALTIDGADLGTVTVTDDGTARFSDGQNNITVSGEGSSSSIDSGQGTFTIKTGTTTRTVTDGQGYVAKILKTDLKAKNGVIHLIDSPLLYAPS